MTDSRENYRQTAALYCRDFIDSIREKPDFIGEVRALDMMVVNAMESADAALVRDMAKVMGVVHEKAMKLYARYPQSIILENIIARSESIRRMLIESAD
ncbi:MAG TPA: hypothetical protein P5346_00805 [Spirochaetota bacterium]|nr:hypothetical protein [Spirochaetota bacterium]HSA13251.1 hypothetical protein [Spirochaetota bacterium]